MKRKILEYNAIFQKEKAGGYSVWIPDLSGCASQGETLEEALANIKDYLEDTPKKLSKESSPVSQFTVPIDITLHG